MQSNLYERIIPSKTQRDLFKERGVCFTDFELAALIHQSKEIEWEDKLSELYELYQKTTDRHLKQQIYEHMDYFDECQKKFESNNGEFIYQLFYLSDSGELSDEKYFFSDVESARVFARSVIPATAIYLEKHYMQSKSADKADKEGSVFKYSDSDIAEPIFLGDEMQEFEHHPINQVNQRFEMRKVLFPVAFIPGDFVKKISNSEIGVVESIEEYKYTQYIKMVQIDEEQNIVTTSAHPFCVERIDDIMISEEYEIYRKLSLFIQEQGSFSIRVQL